MTDEVKDPKEIATPSEEELSKENNGEGEKPETIDYKAEYEKAQKQLGQAEHTILKLKAEKDKQEEPEEDDAETETVQQIAQKEARKYFVNLTKTQARNFAQSVSANEDEFKLIMFHYENTIVPTGDMEADIKRAKLLANEKRIDKEFEQLRRTALSKETRSEESGEGGQKKPIKPQAPELSEKDKKVLRGFTWDAKRQGWIGPSGRFHSQTEIEASIVQK